MKHDPIRVAEAMCRTADLVERHPDTPTLLAEWARGGGGGGSGPGQKGAISDPTGSAATAGDDVWVTLLGRWRVASMYLSPQGAAYMLRGWSTHTARMDQQTLRMWWHRCCELDHIVYETVPMDREAAEELLREEQFLASRSKDCQACESPAEVIKAGLCVPCYEMERKMIQRGRVDMADRVAFVAHVVAGVGRGEIQRPASPYWLQSVPKYVSDEGAA